MGIFSGHQISKNWMWKGQTDPLKSFPKLTTDTFPVNFIDASQEKTDNTELSALQPPWNKAGAQTNEQNVLKESRRLLRNE